MTAPTLLVVAKAPVPGLAKTRLAATIGDEAAAEVAAASLLDTLAVAARSLLPVTVALTGDIAAGARPDDVSAALAECLVIPQRGDGLGERLAHAHRDADQGHGVLQIGMDTPQVTTDLLLAAAGAVEGGRAVIGPADDGGWWLLGVLHGRDADVLRDVPMSHPHTGDLTEVALGGGLVRINALRDIDVWDDAEAVAATIPDSQVAAAVRAVSAGVGR